MYIYLCVGLFPHMSAHPCVPLCASYFSARKSLSRLTPLGIKLVYNYKQNRNKPAKKVAD